MLTLPASVRVFVARGATDLRRSFERARGRRRHPGRRRLPADLPRERIDIVPPASERYCQTCDTAKVRIGADTTEELEYVPASFVIREYVRPKYACASCQQGVVQAALPARPIEKGRPGPGLLAQVVSSKYADHLPLYRLEQIFERHGVEITRRTLPIALCERRQISGAPEQRNLHWCERIIRCLHPSNRADDARVRSHSCR